MTISVYIRQSDSPLPVSSIVVTGIVAQPGGQLGATPLTARENIVTNVTPGSAVILQVLPIEDQTVFNRGGNDVPLPVYPPEGMQIEGNSTNVPVDVADGSDMTFVWDGGLTFLQSDAGGGAGSGLPLTGGTMTGAIVLAADPATALQPATKQYVDAETSARTAAVSSEATTRATADTANATAAAAAQATANAALPVAGGTMTGPIVLAADPAAALQPATKQYVDAETTARTAAVSTEATTRATADTTNATAAAAAQATANAALPLAGGTMTGALTLAADGASTLSAVTLRQLEARLLGYDVTLSGVIDDGVADFFALSQVNNNATITISSGTLSITVANTGPGGVALVTFTNASGATAYANDRWRQQNIAIDGAGAAGATLVAVVAAIYQDNQNTNQFVTTLQLDRPAPTTYTATSHNFACPCFVPGDAAAGRTIWLGNGNFAPGVGPLTGVGFPFLATISVYNSPYSVTLSTPVMGPTLTALPGCFVAWGTDNSAAIATAGASAIAAGYDALLFPGWTTALSKGVFCAFTFLPNDGVHAISAVNYQRSLALTRLRWISSGARTFLTPTPATPSSNFGGDRSLFATPTPVTAPPSSRPRAAINPANFPRCATLSTVNVLIVGDSWSNQDPSGQGNAVASPFMAELQRQNPSRVINVVYSGVVGLTWQGLVHAGIPSTMNVNGSSVVPDLVALFITGENDAMTLYRNDIQTIVNSIRSLGTTNGYPPDVMMITGTIVRGIEYGSENSEEWTLVQKEQNTGTHRSFARCNAIPLLDIAGYTDEKVTGWSSEHMILRRCPALPAGTCGPAAPYVFPSATRDFMVSFVLGTVGQTGTSFWSAAKSLQIGISPKPDQRVIVAPDASNNLNVMATAWGLVVPTTVTLANGSASLTTSGQTAQTVTLNPPGDIGYETYQIGGTLWTTTTNGKCVYVPGGNLFADYRSYGMSYTNGNNVFVADMPAQGSASAASFFGGHMFLPNDAGTADIIIPGAGTVNHPLTGANSLVTTVTARSSQFAVTLADLNAQASLTASVQSVFLGKMSLKPTYVTAVAGAADSGANPVLTLQKKGTHFKLTYVPGGHWNSGSDPRSLLQSNQVTIAEWESECCGGPFHIKVYAGASVTITPVYVWLDERDLRARQFTYSEAFGSNDFAFTAPNGGDGGHPSHRFLTLIGELAGAQNLQLPNAVANNFAVVVATTAGYVIPANQAFTDLNPAGTLGSCPVTLPGVFPQGGRLEIFTSQAITSWTIGAPSGFNLAGPAVSAATAGQTVAYRLTGTTWTRVQ